jgi:hypothetical protein
VSGDGDRCRERSGSGSKDSVEVEEEKERVTLPRLRWFPHSREGLEIHEIFHNPRFHEFHSLAGMGNYLKPPGSRSHPVTAAWLRSGRVSWDVQNLAPYFVGV